MPEAMCMKRLGITASHQAAEPIALIPNLFMHIASGTGVLISGPTGFSVFSAPPW